MKKTATLNIKKYKQIALRADRAALFLKKADALGVPATKLFAMLVDGYLDGQIKIETTLTIVTR